MREASKPQLAQLVRQRCQILGHAIPRIRWDPSGAEGIGTCSRCGDGMLVYVDATGWAIGGTAYDTACPGATCEHGWRIVRRDGAGVVLQCLHCGAERSEE